MCCVYRGCVVVDLYYVDEMEGVDVLVRRSVQQRFARGQRKMALIVSI